MKQCASQKSSSLQRRPLATQKRPAMTSSQPPPGRKSMCRKSNLRLTSWLIWQIRGLRGSSMPSLKYESFQRPAPYFRTQARGNQRFSSSNPRVTCYRCGTPGHKSTQCWKRFPPARYFPSNGSGQNQGVTLSNFVCQFLSPFSPRMTFSKGSSLSLADDRG